MWDTTVEGMIYSVLGEIPENRKNSLVSILNQIIEVWLNEELFKELHSEILYEYDFLAGKYRTLPTCVNWLSIPLSYKVPELMREIFQNNISNFDDLMIFFVNILESIHPFQDANRRTCFLALGAQLSHMGYPIINIGELRWFWESIKSLSTSDRDWFWRAQVFWDEIKKYF